MIRWALHLLRRVGLGVLLNPRDEHPALMSNDDLERYIPTELEMHEAVREYLIPDSWGPELWDNAYEAMMPSLLEQRMMTTAELAEAHEQAERILTERFGPRPNG